MISLRFSQIRQRDLWVGVVIEDFRDLRLGLLNDFGVLIKDCKIQYSLKLACFLRQRSAV